MSEYTIDILLKKAQELKASDLHFIVGEVPSFRIDGKIIKSKLEPVTEEDMMKAIDEMAPISMRDKIFRSYDSDFPYEIEGVSRFRVNIAMSFGCHSMTIRLIPYDIPNFEELKLPKTIEKFSALENGIVLVTGVAGCGKSTTIASILEHVNNTQKKHIVTIEDPIEYVYKSKKSIFTQRQIGIDTGSYIDGLKFALRQDPDVILIGEIRDMETVQSALHAAETGHLVFATLHTFNAVQTINRILSFFPPSEREIVRSQLAEVFRGSVSQKLLPKADGKGRIPAIELLYSTPTIKDFILKDELEEIYKLVQKGSYNDMITFNLSLYDLYKNKLITKETALEHSESPNELMHYIKGVYSGTDINF
ncbi:MAG: PilT/PilU family type 4a pilus ATPase [Candidatus Gastranaerophilales bacterium]|nr:PilT/PilU family type 4a pilus ATPase [Candidatus Gastranaerophilales bacterium]